MFGIRALIIVAAIVAVIFIVRHLFSGNQRKPDSTEKKIEGDQVVACSRCGVHVPESELVQRDGKQVCRECDRV